MKILILYYSKTGHTLEAATATAEGIRSAGSEATLVSAADFKADSLAQYDGLIVGSPCWAGSVTGAGIAAPLLQPLKHLPVGCLINKRGGGISVHCATGGANTVNALGKLAARKGCTDFRPGPAARAGLPLSPWKGPPVSERDKQRFKAYGAEFVA
jgi:NAD(P)H dehydrogenase (quinone)